MSVCCERRWFCRRSSWKTQLKNNIYFFSALNKLICFPWCHFHWQFTTESYSREEFFHPTAGMTIGRLARIQMMYYSRNKDCLEKDNGFHMQIPKYKHGIITSMLCAYRLLITLAWQRTSIFTKSWINLTGLILSLHPANEICSAVFHWLCAQLESARHVTFVYPNARCSRLWVVQNVNIYPVAPKYAACDRLSNAH